MAKRELFDVTLQWLSETDKAIRVTEGRYDEAFWLPKSQIEYERHGNLVEVTLPLWLAQEKNLWGA